MAMLLEGMEKASGASGSRWKTSDCLLWFASVKSLQVTWAGEMHEF